MVGHAPLRSDCSPWWGDAGTLGLYPTCAPFFTGGNDDLVVPVKARYPGGDPLEIGAALGMTFGGCRLVGLLAARGIGRILP